MRYCDFRLTIIPAVLVLVIPFVIITPFLYNLSADNNATDVFTQLFGNGSSFRSDSAE